jgi:glycosyltransferase involved in cell wall biosynthesis
MVYKPFVRHLERSGIAAADSVSTVGVGLSRALAHLYGLAEPPLVVRNVPDRTAAPDAAKTEWPLRLLYHGIVMPHRGLEELIAAASRWREPHALTIRGHGADGYVSRLKAAAAASAAASRIRFAPPVPPGEVIAAAARDADVGVFFPPLETIQQRFMLPNKLFEYIGAGLAIAVSPAPDMVEVVERHGAGLVGRGWSVDDIVEVIDGLTKAKVEAWKTASRAAATELTWTRESLLFRERIEQLLAS